MTHEEAEFARECGDLANELEVTVLWKDFESTCLQNGERIKRALRIARRVSVENIAKIIADEKVYSFGGPIRLVPHAQDRAILASAINRALTGGEKP